MLMIDKSDLTLHQKEIRPEATKCAPGRIRCSRDLPHTQQRAAVVVYRHGAHVINVFSWAATQPCRAS
jgi:hypothetical protein